MTRCTYSCSREFCYAHQPLPKVDIYNFSSIVACGGYKEPQSISKTLNTRNGCKDILNVLKLMHDLPIQLNNARVEVLELMVFSEHHWHCKSSLVKLSEL